MWVCGGVVVGAWVWGVDLLPIPIPILDKGKGGSAMVSLSSVIKEDKGK